jgi:glycosyltransferase involved in cell wall biosynthesis
MTTSDFICFSHLRWGFAFQRPNHLMVRFARRFRTFFVEEPRTLQAGEPPRMEVTLHPDGPYICVPWVPAGLDRGASVRLQRELLAEMLREHRIHPRILWFYTPMAGEVADEIDAPLVVYDCMDELSAHRGAPPELLERERLLLARADLVFTGGPSLYREKRGRHPEVFCFPNSVDTAHFGRARTPRRDPEDQREIPRPRLGYVGVIDERVDLDLLARVADARPDWHLVMLGPVVTIDPASLPRRENIHWLGHKSYDELPEYLGGWDVALMPFACNESTDLISPTKTLEYLAAGKPVVSTPITDVIEPYGSNGLVRVATPDRFVEAIAATLAEDPRPVRDAADAVLARMSWDETFERMVDRISDVLVHGARATRVTKKDSTSWSTA